MAKISEHKHQVVVMNYWGKRYPKYYACLFSIPNGAMLAGNKMQRCRQMNSLKSEGLMPGVSDLFLMVARCGYHGLFIEMKAEKGRLSEPQQEHIDRAREQGYMAEVCYGNEQAIDLLDKYMNSELTQ
jgi:hypothetical protein